jgi:hypothetical protein
MYVAAAADSQAFEDVVLLRRVPRSKGQDSICRLQRLVDFNVV